MTPAQQPGQPPPPVGGCALCDQPGTGDDPLIAHQGLPAHTSCARATETALGLRAGTFDGLI